MVKKIFLSILLFFFLFTSGCWDRKDIEKRAFILGITFDKVDSEVAQEQIKKLGEPELYAPRFTITYVHPLPKVVIGEGIGEDTFTTKSITASIAKEAEKEMATRTNLELFFGHTDLVLFGEEVLNEKKDVREILDYLHRNKSINWNVNVAVVEGKAKDIFKIKPKEAPLLAPYMVGIMENKAQNSKIGKVTLKQMFSDMEGKGTMLLPRMKGDQDEVKIEGAALIKDFTLRGYLTGQQARSFMFLKGIIQGGSMVTRYENVLIPYTIVNAQVKKEVKTTKNGLEFVFKIESEGQLEEGIYGEELLNDTHIKEIEKLVEEEIKKDSEELIGKLQGEYKTDVIDVGNTIKKFHPKIWKQVESNWDEIFCKMDIKTQVKVNIRRVGAVK